MPDQEDEQDTGQICATLWPWPRGSRPPPSPRRRTTARSPPTHQELQARCGQQGGSRPCRQLPHRDGGHPRQDDQRDVRPTPFLLPQQVQHRLPPPAATSPTAPTTPAPRRGSTSTTCPAGAVILSLIMTGSALRGSAAATSARLVQSAGNLAPEWMSEIVILNFLIPIS